MNLNNKIEWLQGGATWNPVVGCLNSCPYCYARKIAYRFWGKKETPSLELHELLEPVISGSSFNCHADSFPYAFDPTFHRYRLDEPQKVKKPQNIFVCSMADLFGKWIPDEWIQQVFEACENAPQHRYLFLTKNPRRYINLYLKKILPSSKNLWFGSTTETDTSPAFYSVIHNTFVSIEPIMSSFEVGGKAYGNNNINWAIIGAETGAREGKVIPKREWIENIVSECRKRNVPVFMKNSLSKNWGEPLIQEYPW